MPTQIKKEIVEEVQSKIQNSSGVYFANYKGMNVSQVNSLRRDFRNEGVEYKVIKNNLTKIAAKNAGIDGLDDLLVGQIGIAFSEHDPTAPARVIKKCIKDKNPLEIKKEFDKEISGRILKRLETRKKDLAQDIFDPILDLSDSEEESDSDTTEEE